ncbi:MAG: CtsR family transcriptional regulator [Clostridia bacterium]|nr:CtsR family transcriptional regulator [Clostridia bacterium]MBR2391182.1 CtsR family transcriptional regulator [Clostridia bacterium]
MANISETIEQFIIATLGENDSVDISRNSLAEYFSCAPSQINYVLDTRFTIDRGFVKESKRGGSGYIKISKLKNTDDNEYLNSLVLESVGDELSEKRMVQILEKLVSDNIVSLNEKVLIEAALSEDSLAMPFTIKDKVRAKSFKNILIELMKK